MTAKGHHGYHGADLTKNQVLVMGALAEADGPLSAYTILDQLRECGFRAPLQVYRALEKLVEFGLVHRLETLNAFVACRQPGCEGRESIAFTICEACGQVAEITDDSLARRLNTIASEASFALKKSTIELRGICRACDAD
ncbi:MAG: Fur family transcriptional regulator [Rhodomicrobiaceae bacterium]